MKRSLLPRWLRRKPVRPLSRLQVTNLEDRLTPSLTIVLNGGTGALTVSSDAADTISISSDGTFVFVGDGINPLVGFAGVKSLAVTDTAASAGQSVTFAANSAILLESGLAVTGIESVSVLETVDCSAGGAGISVSGATTITASSKLITDTGDLSLNGQTVTWTGGRFSGNGKVDISAESISIDATSKVTASGPITLQTTDLAAAGQSISVAGAVQSGKDAIILSAGDDVTIVAGASLIASKSMTVTVDAASADTDGGIATIGGTLDAASVSITGGSDADTFSIVAQTKVEVTVDGGDPALAPGDTLNVDAQNKSFNQTATQVKVSGAKPVTYANIETVNVLNKGGMLISGTAGNDTVVLRNNGGTLQVDLNGGGFTNVTGSSVEFAGDDGSDTFTADFTGGPIVLPGGVTFDGQAGTDDLLRVLGAPGSTGTYFPDAAVKGNGKVVVDGLTANFVNLTPVDVVGMASFSVMLPGDADILTVDQGKLFGDATKDAIVIAGTSGGVGIETVAVRDVGLLTIDTTAVDVAGKDDSITLTALDSAPLVVDFTITTGVGADVVEFKGTPNVSGDLSVTTGTVLVSTAAMTTGGAQTYTATSLTLGVDATFESTTNKDLTFSTPITGAFKGTFNTTGATNFSGTVNIDTLITNAGGTTNVAANQTGATALTYNDDVVVTADVTFDAPTVTFAGKLDGAKNVIVNATTTTFTGVIGGTTPLVTLKTDGAGTTNLGADATASTSITFGDAVVVSGDTTITAPTVSFDKTLDGAKNVTVNATTTTFSGVIGGTTPLVTLKTDGAGTTNLGADATASTSITFGDAVTVTVDTTIAAPTVTFDKTLDGAKNVIVNATTTTFTGVIGGTTPLVTLKTDAAGTTNLGANATASTSITFGDAVVVSGDTTITAPTVSFDKTLDGAMNVTVNATTTTFTGVIGGTTPLVTLKTDAAGTTNLGANATTSTSITFGDAVTVTGDTTITAPTVSFDKTLDGARNVTVNATTTTFTGVIGGTTPLVTLKTDAAGTTKLGANATASTSITFGDAVVVTGDTTITVPTVSFDKTLDGAKNVTVNATTTTFTGVIGGTTPLVTLKTDVAGTTKLGANATASTSITFGDAVVVTGDTTITAPTVSFDKTLDGAKNVTVNATTTTFSGAVGGTTPLASLTTDAAGDTTFNKSPVVTDGDQKYNDNVNATTDIIFVSLSGGAISFNKLDATGAVDVQTGGVTSFNGPATVGTSLTTDAPGSTVINANITAGDAIAFNDKTTVTGTRTVQSTNNKTISFNNTLDGPGTLTITTSGDTTFAKAVGGTTPLAAITTDGGGRTLVNGGGVTTTGNQTWNDAVVVGKDTTFASSGGGAIAFNSTLDGAFNIFVNTGGAVTFKGAVGGTAAPVSLTTDAGGTTSVGNDVKATTSIVFNDAVTVTADTTFTAPTVTFGSTLNGAKNVTVNATTTSFNGVIGGTTPLVTLKTDAAGTTNLGANATATTSITFGDAVVVTGDTTITAPTVTFDKTLDGAKNVTVNATTTNFTGVIGGTTPLVTLKTDAAGTTNLGANATATTSITFGDAVVVTGDTVITAPTVSFDKTLDGAKNVTVNATTTTFTGVIGGTTPLVTLKTDAAGTTNLGANATATTSITFGDAVVVTGDTTITAPTVTFGKTLDGAKNVIVNATTTSFNGVIGGTTPLVTLKTDAAGTTNLGANATATTSVTFGDAVVVTGDTTITAPTVSFDKTLDGGFNVTVNATGATTFTGKIGATTPLASLTTDAPGTTAINGGVVTTTGAQSFNDDVTVGADTVFTAGGNVTFADTLTGAFAVTVDSPATTTFLGTVTLDKLFTIGGGETDLNGGTVTTTGVQSYGDDVLLSVNTTLISTADSIVFNKSVNPTVAGFTLDLSAANSILFSGPAGNVATLGQVTVNTAKDVTFFNTSSLTASGFAQITGTGTTKISGPVSVATAAGINLKTTSIVLDSNIASVGDITFNATTAGVNQTSGALTASANLVLLGNGGFLLAQPNNDIVGTLRINTGAGAVTVNDANSLTIDQGGIKTVNATVVLNVGTNFTAVDATKTYVTPLIDVGTGLLIVQPGLSTTLLDATKSSIVNFDAEIKALQAFFGIPGGANKFGDSFNIRPSAFTPLFVYGNLPTPPGIPVGNTVDRLLPDLTGLTVTNFTFDGQNGFYEFVGRQKLQFFGIESLDKLGFSAAAVQTGEPGDGTGATQPVYSIRVSLAQTGVTLPSGLDGSGLPQNAFVVSPALIDPRNPYAAPRMAFAALNAGDTIPELLIANGPGTGALVSIVDGQKLFKNADGTLNRLDNLNFSNGLLAQFFPYDPRFTGGVNVAAADVNGTNAVRIVTAPDAGGGPQIRVFRYDDPTRTVVEAGPSFFAFDPNFRGGVRTAMGDVNGDGVTDIVLAAGIGGGPHVRVVDGFTYFSSGVVTYIRDFFAYEANFRGGVFVDAGDYTGDGKADILVGPGRGGADRIRVFSGANLAVVADFFAGVGSSKSDPLFGVNNGYRAGVGGVAFTFAANAATRDILVSSPRTTPVIVKQFTGNGTTPTMSVSFFAAPTITPITPDPSSLLYGATVEGLN